MTAGALWNTLFRGTLAHPARHGQFPDLPMAVDEYRRKRHVERTAEPFGGPKASEGTGPQRAGMFVVQKHLARRLHYDFRLEMEGVLRSWAVPRGPSLNPAERRLAVTVEDHPLEYADFEGVIPPGNYGAGSVIVWDRGRYSVIDPPDTDAADAVRRGKLDIELRGYKLRGAYTLVRTHLKSSGAQASENWLLIKKRDQYASGEDVTATHPRSVLSGLTVDEMREAGELAKQVIADLKRAHAPRLSGRLEAKKFPLSLARLVREPFDSDKWLFEIKYDGVRALAIRDRRAVALYARSGAVITERYPEIALAFDALPYERFVMDGEIVALDDKGRPDFQALQRRMHVSDASAARRLSLSIPAYDFVFDLLAFDDFDLRPLALETRKSILARLIRGEGPVRYCDHVTGKGKAFFRAVSKARLEGMMAKRRESPYRGARSSDWLKIKCPLVRRFVIGGWTDPAGSRTHFGALLLGLYDPNGELRFVGKVGTGFSAGTLEELYRLMRERTRKTSPFAKPRASEAPIPSRAHFCAPEMVCEVRFAEVTNDNSVRHPSFLRLLPGAAPEQCRYEHPFGARGALEAKPPVPETPARAAAPARKPAVVEITNADKVFWPAEGYTKGALVAYYRSIARWMLPYLKDRPVMVVRYPDGIEGKSFFQKDAPEYVPEWIRTERIYSEDSGREIAFFILESAEALAYVANLGAIALHMWSSRVGQLERPDWLLFDIDPKGSTTANAVRVARQVIAVLAKLKLRAVVKTSGQAGIHVFAGLKPIYTYAQARNFAELVARLVVHRIPELATINRDVASRKGRVYIDYLQLGYGKTIAAPYTVRPVPGARVSAPLRAKELRVSLDPGRFTIKTMARRMARMKQDPFIGALEDRQALEPALALLEKELGRAKLVS
jgi:bifunctional non-homologous end joining protein LigD